VSNLDGTEVERLRADILWAGKRWRPAGEQIEKMYGERWREFTPLSDSERPDILRGGIAFALAEDTLGLTRFREKYAAKMAEGPDARVFAVVTAPLGATVPEFREIARVALSTPTLDQFLRDLRNRYPDTGAVSPSRPNTAGRPPAPAAAARGQGPPALAAAR
jgi:hypothetical protein